MGNQIKFEPNELEGIMTKMTQHANEIVELISTVEVIMSELSDNVLGRYGLDSQISTLKNNINNTFESLNNNSIQLKNAIDIMQQQDKLLANNFNGVMYNANTFIGGTAIVSPTTIGGTMALQDVNFLNGQFGLKTNTNTFSSNTLFSSIANAWNSRIGKTIRAGVSIIVSGAAIACAWGATALSAGIGTPGAVAVSIYGVNNILNKFSDLYYLWDLDDSNDDKVGNTNLLKGGAEWVGKKGGGAVGDLIESAGVEGAGDAGRAIGTGVADIAYYAGEIVSAKINADAVGKVFEGASYCKEIDKIVSPSVRDNVISLTLDKAGLGDNKGEMAVSAKQILQEVGPLSGLESCSDDNLEKVVNLGFAIKDVAGEPVNLISNYGSIVEMFN